MALGGPGSPPKVERKTPGGFGAAEWNAISQIWTLRPGRQDGFPGALGKAVSSRAQAFGFTAQSSKWCRLQSLYLVMGGL